MTTISQVEWLFYCTWLLKLWASLVAQAVKNLPAMWETQVWSLGRPREDPLEEGMATNSCILAWRIPWREEPGRLQAMGSQSQTWLSDQHFHFHWSFTLGVDQPSGLGFCFWDGSQRRRFCLNMLVAQSCERAGKGAQRGEGWLQVSRGGLLWLWCLPEEFLIALSVSLT